MKKFLGVFTCPIDGSTRATLYDKVEECMEDAKKFKDIMSFAFWIWIEEDDVVLYEQFQRMMNPNLNIA